jgi:hypothetical protein
MRTKYKQIGVVAAIDAITTLPLGIQRTDGGAVPVTGCVSVGAFVRAVPSTLLLPM